MSRYPVSCLDRSAADAFGTVLAFHLQGDRVLDLTYGEGLSWKGLQQPSGLVKNSADIFAPHPEWEGFDLAYYDPPYFLGVENRDPRSQAYGGYTSTADQLRQFMEFVGEIPRFLRTGGKVIVKCGDQYHVRLRMLLLHHVAWIQAVGASFEVVDFYVYRYHRVSPTAYQVKARPSAVITHSYFIVGRKP